MINIFDFFATDEQPTRERFQQFIEVLNSNRSLFAVGMELEEKVAQNIEVFDPELAALFRKDIETAKELLAHVAKKSEYHEP